MNTVYVDVVFITNFCVDFMVMYAALRFLHIKVPFFRLVISAVVGGIFGVLTIIIRLSVLLHILSLVCVFIIMMVMILRKRSFQTYIKSIIISVSMFILFGGCITAVLSFTDKQKFSPIMLISCAGLFVVIVINLSQHLASAVSVKSVIVHITLNGIEKKLIVLCDSGNILIDPHNKLPVIVFGRSVKNMFFHDKNCTEEPVKIRLIPIRTPSGLSFVYSHTPENVQIVSGNNAVNVGASVGFTDTDCFEKDGYDGILPSVLLNNL